MNKVILIGNIGKDPIVRYIDEDIIVAKFSLATTEFIKRSNGEREEQTEWHNIVVWRELAKYVERRLQKGDKIAIEGKIKTRSWENKEGVQRYTTEIIAQNIILLSKKKTNEQDVDKNSVELEGREEDNLFDNDLPSF